MKLQEVKVSLDAIELSAEPPKEILLFAEGWTKTKKGDFLFDEEAADLTLASLATDGRDRLPFDIGHGMLTGTDVDRHKAAGWFKPEVRNGDLLAADIEWTPSAFEALSNREFRFHSPALTYDKKSRRVTGLINVALTNIPATNSQTPLVLDSSTSDGDEAPQQQTKDNMKLIELLGVSEDKVEGAVEALHAAHIELQSEKDAVVAELTALKAAAVKAERDVAIKALSAEGKLPPSQHEFAALLSADQFEAFVSTLSVVVNKEESSSEAPVATLSDVEKAMCVQLGISEDEFLAQKESK